MLLPLVHSFHNVRCALDHGTKKSNAAANQQLPTFQLEVMPEALEKMCIARPRVAQVRVSAREHDACIPQPADNTHFKGCKR